MKTKSLIAVALNAVSGVFASTAAAGQRADTQVKIKGSDGDYYGYVKSADAGNCANGRSVSVYQMTGSSPKPKQDLKIGSDIAQANGPKYMWSIGNSGYKDGYFYAKVKKTAYCQADVSKVIAG